MVALAVAACGNSGAPDPLPPITAIQEGEGPCDQGFNLTLEGKRYFVPLGVLPRTTVMLDGAAQEAIALPELLPAELLAPLGFEGEFSTDQLRALYDGRLAGEAAESSAVTLSPEAMATGHLLVASRAVQLGDGTSGELQGVCRVAALRRLLVTRGEAEARVTRVVHVVDLPTVPHEEEGVQQEAVRLTEVVAAAGLLAAGEETRYDYRLVPVDLRQRREKAVRFPWGHGHLTHLRWVPAQARTRSVDTAGDLQSPEGAAIYRGVAASGWSAVKHLLEIALEPAPDPAHTASGPDGPLTDPASCHGCHESGGRVVIPVGCGQCHGR